jgi:hypothetical protein
MRWPVIKKKLRFGRSSKDNRNFDVPFAPPLQQPTVSPSSPRCRLLELPAELRIMIWKEALTLKQAIPFRLLERSGYSFDPESPSRHLRLPCKQIQSEIEGIVLKVNIFRFEIVDGRDGDALELARNSPFWFQISFLEFKGSFKFRKPTGHHQKCDEASCSVYQAVKILSEGTFRIKNLEVGFMYYNAGDILLKHVGYFSRLKVENMTSFCAYKENKKPTQAARKDYKRLFKVVAEKNVLQMMRKSSCIS